MYVCHIPNWNSQEKYIFQDFWMERDVLRDDFWASFCWFKKKSVGEILLVLILSGLGVVEKGDLFPVHKKGSKGLGNND